MHLMQFLSAVYFTSLLKLAPAFWIALLSLESFIGKSWKDIAKP